MVLSWFGSEDLQRRVNLGRDLRRKHATAALVGLERLCDTCVRSGEDHDTCYCSPKCQWRSVGFCDFGLRPISFDLSLSNSHLGFRVVCCKVYGFRPFNLEKKNRMMILM